MKKKGCLSHFIFAFSHLSSFLFSTLAAKKGMFKFHHPNKSFPNDCKNIFLFSFQVLTKVTKKNRE